MLPTPPVNSGQRVPTLHPNNAAQQTLPELRVDRFSQVSGPSPTRLQGVDGLATSAPRARPPHLLQRIRTWIVAHPWRTAAVVGMGVLAGASFAVPGLPVALAIVGVVAWGVYFAYELSEAGHRPPVAAQADDNGPSQEAGKSDPAQAVKGDLAPQIPRLAASGPSRSPSPAGSESSSNASSSSRHSTFRANHRSYLSSSSSGISAEDHKEFGIAQARTMNVYAGEMEADALGKGLNVRIRLWRRQTPGHYRFQLGTGSNLADLHALNQLPEIHLVNNTNVHFTEFKATDINLADHNDVRLSQAYAFPAEHFAQGTEQDHGGEGDCLYRAVRGALPPDHPYKHASIQALRNLTAETLESYRPEAFELEANVAEADARSEAGSA